MTLEQAQKRYEKYLDAELKILDGQTVRFGDRTITRADLSEIQRGIQLAAREIQRIKNKGRGYSVGVCP